MSDNDNDIDALLRLWSVQGFEDHRRYRAALTALVAERDALKATIVLLQSRAESSKALNSTAVRVISERDALKQRVAELEEHPPADRDRELRERLICAALTGLCADPRHDVCEEVAVAIADRTLAAMRKGETDGK